MKQRERERYRARKVKHTPNTYEAVDAATGDRLGTIRKTGRGWQAQAPTGAWCTPRCSQGDAVSDLREVTQ